MVDVLMMGLWLHLGHWRLDQVWLLGWGPVYLTALVLLYLENVFLRYLKVLHYLKALVFALVFLLLRGWKPMLCLLLGMVLMSLMPLPFVVDWMPLRLRRWER